jgi:hypothetical protein
VTAVVPRSLSPPRRSAKRSFAALAGLTLMASIALLFYRAAPGAPAIILTALTGFTGLAALALAFTLDDAALSKFTSAVAAGAAIVVLCALVSPDARLSLASFASVTFGVGLVGWLARTARVRPRFSWPLAALFAVTLALMSTYAAYLVLASRDLMIADFMTYRGIAMMVARLADAGNWPLLLSAVVQSVTQEPGRRHWFRVFSSRRPSLRRARFIPSRSSPSMLLRLLWRSRSWRAIARDKLVASRRSRAVSTNLVLRRREAASKDVQPHTNAHAHWSILRDACCAGSSG